MKKKSTLGRPTKRTPERENAFIEAIRNGSSIKEACLIAGISVETYSQWMKKFPEFSDLKRHAEFEPMKRALKCITSSFFHDWRAAAWWLERRHPEEFGRNRTNKEREPPCLVIDPDGHEKVKQEENEKNEEEDWFIM